MSTDAPSASSPTFSIPIPRFSVPPRLALFLKLSLLGFLVLVLQIPIAHIQDTVRERRQTRETAIQGVTSTWGDRQTITGPVLAVPYVVHVPGRNETEPGQTVPHTAYFLPESLTVRGRVRTETRYRGIFEVPVYLTTLEIAGTLGPPDFSRWPVAAKDILWDGATLAFGVTDPKAIRERVRLTWNEAALEFGPGLGQVSFLPAGLSVPIPGLSAAPPAAAASHAFSFSMTLGGSSELRVVPVGTETQVQLESDWPDPSFVGAYLPAARTVTPAGFDATWKLPDLGRNYPRRWRDEEVAAEALAQSAFGVSLISPVDAYTTTTRAVKYELLFVGLTFVAFYLIELFRKLRIHAVQYLLVGFALCLFYLLLLGLSEHIGFSPAYGIAAAAVVGTIGGYCAAILRTKGLAAFVAAELAALYGFLFVLLQIQDYALLVGSIGLFAVLAGIMFATRNVDWYQVASRPAVQ